MTAQSDMTLKSAEVMRVNLPLTSPVQLGAQEISAREYIVLRLTLADGSEGFAYAYTRGLPLFEITVEAARRYVGGSADMRCGLQAAAMGQAPAPHAALARGVSLCDIALWGAWCRAVGKPLWKVLGGAREAAVAMPVIGYGMTPERAASETADLAARGFTVIKLMIDGRDPEADIAVMEAMAGALPPGCGFGIDAHWSWTSKAQAMRTCRAAERLGARFVEDPVAPARWRVAGEIAGEVPVPLAMGEDVTDIATLRDIAGVSAILRIDASVMGGISGTRTAMALAQTFSRPVISHVFPALHLHFALAAEGDMTVETILPELGADPIDRFLLEQPRIENGMFLAGDTPGEGLRMDFDRLSDYAIQTERVTQ